MWHKIISDFTPFGLHAYLKWKGVTNSSTVCTAEPRTDSDMGPLASLLGLWKFQAQHSHCSLRNMLPFPLLPVQFIFPEATAMLPFGLALPFKLQYWLQFVLWQHACYGTIKNSVYLFCSRYHISREGSQVYKFANVGWVRRKALIRLIKSRLNLGQVYN